MSSLVKLQGIGKRFSGVWVLRKVDFELTPGEVHVLAGENGAGKSTLMRILAGAIAADEGEIRLGGEPVRFRSPLDAAASGIAMIHQELSLVGPMSIAENVLLGRERVRARAVVDGRAQRREARALLARLGLDLDPDRPVESLPVSVQQMIEIAKALAFDARVIVMDEPTSALDQPETERLFGIIAELKQRGCALAFISHKLDEIYRLADRITVLRDGECAGTASAAALPREALVRRMVGREIEERSRRRRASPGRERLRLEHLWLRDPTGARAWSVEDVSLRLREGEILGIAGLQGSGKSELLGALFGAQGAPARGRVVLDGEPVELRSPRAALARGLALLTNDRARTGLVRSMSAAQNISLPSLARFSRLAWLRGAAEAACAERHRRALGIRLASIHQPVGELSGGNQQKVALAKWLETEPAVLLLDEPTRGVDVGAKQEIYALIEGWAERGIAIALVTSELPELISLSDRILVMHRGRPVREFAGAEATQEAILQAAMGEAQ